ncbi:MAG: ABC transporter substrate-binding protein [Candidatus Riflebacteria bacterium]|nr:ABC transporter substrate-binding protein [Candidatus Riflebacteria bacterium]
MHQITSFLQRTAVLLFLAVTILLGFPTASLAQATPSQTLTVGSKSIQEGILLGKLMIGALQEKGFKVIDRTDMGKTEDLRKALQSSEIDLYPEYTGTAGLFFPEVDQSVWKDSKSGYETAKRLDEEKNGIIWLTPASADNSWVIAVTQDLANQGISSLPKFATFIHDGGKVILGSLKQLIQRSDGLPAFAEAYQFKLDESQILALDQLKPGESPAAPPKDFNALLTLGSSAQIAGWNMVVLEDPAKVPMVFRPTPITRRDVIAKHGQKIDEALEPLFKSLDMATLIKLNTRVVVEKISPDVVAAAYLKEIKKQ